ncbi:hypothetical protein FNV43_RR10630 [Rhamnella rubrinervis]|uniref:Uncharacterized protein n=1 Tax=Rhamnella rubrinervis TaxID=2594499 RepID=A0A8K0H4K1_9ROSA|nr:hypothetical protein FNV43_RR10630 [Rhamnella rubrinervis]
MDEAEAEAPHSAAPPFLEVKCKSSGKTRRFAEGTDAGFAVSLMNRKLDNGAPKALLIEAIKEGEEPISFGPNSLLVDYGVEWKLHTVTEVDFAGAGIGNGEGLVRPRTVRVGNVNGSEASHLQLGKKVPKPAISFVYIAKIVVAFVLMFVLGAIFTIALENLPSLVQFLSSSM